MTKLQLLALMASIVQAGITGLTAEEAVKRSENILRAIDKLYL